MFIVKTRDWGEFNCLIEQNTANHKGWSDQPIFIAQYITNIIYMPKVFKSSPITFKMPKESGGK